jgi:branched-chain amino acid transport system substrate-binding protein
VKKVFFILLVLFSLSVLAGICGCSAKFGKHDYITIGVLLPLTGPDADEGLRAYNGLQLAKDEINAAGGVSGKKLDLIILNDRGDKSYILQQYYTLRGMGAVAIIGSSYSDVTMVLADAAEIDGMPLITPTASSPDITKDRNNVFRTIFIDDYQAEVLAYFAKNTLQAKKALVLSNKDVPDYKLLSDVFVESFTADGGEVVAVENYTKSNDFPGILRKYARNKPDVIFCPADFFYAANLVNSALEAGFTNTHLLGSDEWDGLFSYVYYPWAVGNVYYPSPFSFDDEDADVVRFVRSYFNTFSQLPLSASATSYASLYVLAEAIKNADSTRRPRIISALLETDMQTIIGRIKFDEKNNPHPNVYILQIVGGVYSTYEKLSL